MPDKFVFTIHLADTEGGANHITVIGTEIEVLSETSGDAAATTRVTGVRVKDGEEVMAEAYWPVAWMRKEISSDKES